MNTSDVLPSLTCSIVRPEWPEEDVLAWMALLHLHQVVLHPDVLIDDLPPDGQPTVFEPETQRGAAGCVAKVWPTSDQRSNYAYWYSLYTAKTPFSDITEMPPEMVQKLIAFKELLKSQPMVVDVRLES